MSWRICRAGSNSRLPRIRSTAETSILADECGAISAALVRFRILRYQMRMILMRNSETMIDSAAAAGLLRTLLLGLICDRRAR